MTRPAVLGGPVSFPEGLPFVQPSMPPLDEVVRRLRPGYDTGRVTDGPLVRQLEEAASERLDVPEVVAVSSCTVGLMLVLRALGPQGPVALPGFTFAATAHAVDWNGRALKFVECDERTFQADTADLRRKLAGAGALIVTHVFGAPCDPTSVEAAAAEAGLPALFDSAHAFGATHRGRPVGSFGTAEVFSLTPTKPLVAGEGGLVATRDAALARAVRVGRNYGNPGNYDSEVSGLNGRLSELHAAVALASLERFDEDLATRRRLAQRYRSGVAAVPGLSVQEVATSDESTWKDFTVRVDAGVYGLGAAELRTALTAEGVDTRRYFFPPVHLHTTYRDRYGCRLPVTESVAGSVLSLPIWPALEPARLDRVVEILAAVHEHAEEICQPGR